MKFGMNKGNAKGYPTGKKGGQVMNGTPPSGGRKPPSGGKSTPKSGAYGNR